ncbi:sensor domain-containing diguanylate cyclase [Clostridium sp. Marseille-P299]|uniref:sensor domain-containing diguanylate cyclase n=1 Tax=Clostridium sp. Marseille-P299 TaxID=1805477 RepID=UPI0008312AA5|nr:sensor domain-containing diguanylate cyclase [Clostridium sp. Marseille-P299]
MEKDGAVFNQHSFAKTHIYVGIIFWIFTFIQAFSVNDSVGIISLICASFLLIVNFGVAFLGNKGQEKILIGIRFVQLIIISYTFLVTLGNPVSVFFELVYLLLIIELMLIYDITDTYIRKVILLITSTPCVIVMIFYLIIQQRNQEILFAMLCTVIANLFFVYHVSKLISEQVVNAEKKLFKERRLSESTKEAIDALKIHQEKVKKANEELGIQKIKLEAAYNKINSVNSEMTIQNTIIKYISSSLEINTLMELITESIFEAFGLHICAIVLQPKVANSKEITYRVRTRISTESEALLSNAILQGSFEPYIESKDVYIDNQVQAGKYPFICKNEIKSLLIIPLVMGAEANGALICGHSGGDFFDDNLEFFETIVAQFLIALHNADMFSKMKDMAIRDSLTGIYNRGQLNAQVDKFSKHAAQTNSPLSVALIDIDRFKQINDTYGHLFGDEVIKKIAEYADIVARKHNGIAARYGGEEFVMVFPDCGVKECASFVEEMRAMVRDIRLECDGQVVKTRVSVGIASYPETCDRVHELLNRADEAMYFSKKSGRNQVTIDTKEIHEFVNLQNE